MRGVVIYVRYIVIPAAAFIAVVWAVHFGRQIAKKITSKRDKKNGR